jgi:amino acid transporter
VSKTDISVLEGIVQAVGHMARRVGIAWVTVPFALMLSFSIAGIGSAWMGGSARIPFVAGLDSYLPGWLARVHPKYSTPYAALIVQAVVSAALVVLNFAGGERVQGAFQRMLSLAVVLQLVPFLYMFAALVKIGWTGDTVGRYGRKTLVAAGLAGFTTTFLGIALVFFPAQQIASVFSYEVWMIGGTVFFIALAAFFFFVYGRRKVSTMGSVGTGVRASQQSEPRSVI